MSQLGKGIAALKCVKAAVREKSRACKRNSNKLNRALGSRTAYINIFTDFILLNTPLDSGQVSFCLIGIAVNRFGK